MLGKEGGGGGRVRIGKASDGVWVREYRGGRNQNKKRNRNKNKDQSELKRPHTKHSK